MRMQNIKTIKIMRITMLLMLIGSVILGQLDSLLKHSIYATETNKIKLIDKKETKLNVNYTFDIKNNQINWEVDFKRAKSELPRLFSLNIAGNDQVNDVEKINVNGKRNTEDLQDKQNVFNVAKGRQATEKNLAMMKVPSNEPIADKGEDKKSYTYADVLTTKAQAIHVTFTTTLVADAQNVELKLTPYLTEYERGATEVTEMGNEILPVDKDKQEIVYVVNAKRPTQTENKVVATKTATKDAKITVANSQPETSDKEATSAPRPSGRAATVGTAAIPTLLASNNLLDVYKIKLLNESFTNDTTAELNNFNWYIKSTGTAANGLGEAGDVYNFNTAGNINSTVINGNPGNGAQNLIGVNKQTNITAAPVDYGGQNTNGDTNAKRQSRRTGYHIQYGSNRATGAQNNSKIIFELSNGLFTNNNRGTTLRDNSLELSVSFGDVGLYYETPGSEGKKMGAIITISNVKKFNADVAWIDIPASLFSGVAYGNIDTLDIEYTFYEMVGDTFGRKLNLKMPPLNVDGSVNPADATWMTFGSLNNHSTGNNTTSTGATVPPANGGSVGTGGTNVNVLGNQNAEGIKKLEKQNDADAPDLKTVKAVGSLLRLIPDTDAMYAGYFVSSAMGIYTGHAAQATYQGNDPRQFGDFLGAVDFEKVAVSFQVSGTTNKFSMKTGSTFTWQPVSSGYSRPINPKNPQKAVTALTTNPLDMVHESATQKANNVNNRDTITNGSGNETLNFLPTTTVGQMLDLYDGIYVNGEGNPFTPTRPATNVHFYDVSQPTYQNPNDSVAKPHTITLTDTLPLGIIPNLPANINLPTGTNQVTWTFVNNNSATNSVSLWNSQSTNEIGVPTSTTHTRYAATTTRSAPVISRGTDGRYTITWTLTGSEISALDFNGGEFIFRIPVRIDHAVIPDTPQTAHQFLNEANVNFNLTDDTNEAWDWNGRSNQVRTRVSFPRGYEEVLTQIFVEKLWNDDNSWYAQQLRPNSIEMKIYQKIGRTGQWVDSGRIAQVTPSNDWRTTVSALPATYMQANGTVDDIFYKIEEDNVPAGFIKATTGNAKEIERDNINGPEQDGVDGNVVTRSDVLGMTTKDNNTELTALIAENEQFQNAFFIENRPEYDRINIGGYKYWQDENGTPLAESAIPTEGVTVHLYRNGTVYGEPIHLPRTNATGLNRWKFDFADLPRIDENGNVIIWDISEDQLDGYAMTKVVQSNTNEEFSRQIDFYNTKDATERRDENDIRVIKNWSVDNQVVLPGNLWIMLYAQYPTKAAIPTDVINANVPTVAPTDTDAVDYKYRLANYQNYNTADADAPVKLMINRRALNAGNTWQHTYEKMQMLDTAGDEIQYTLDEEVPRGFIMTSMTEELSFDGTRTDITLTNVTNRIDRNGSISLTKIDQGTNTALANAYFRLEHDSATSGNPKWSLVGTKYTGADGKLNFEALISGRYRIIEIQAPNGYHLAKGEITFEMERDVDGQIKIKAGTYHSTDELASMTMGTTAVSANQYSMKVQNRLLSETFTYGNQGATFELQRGLTDTGTNATTATVPNNWSTARTSPTGNVVSPSSTNRTLTFTTLDSGWYRLYQVGNPGYVQFRVNGNNTAPSVITYVGLPAGGVFSRVNTPTPARYQMVYGNASNGGTITTNATYGGVNGTFHIARIAGGTNGTSTRDVTATASGELNFGSLMTAAGTQTYRLNQTGASTGNVAMTGYIDFDVTRTVYGEETLSNVRVVGGAGSGSIATGLQANNTSAFITTALAVQAQSDTGDLSFRIGNEPEPVPFPATGGRGVLGIVIAGLIGAFTCYLYFNRKRKLEN